MNAFPVLFASWQLNCSGHESFDGDGDAQVRPEPLQVLLLLLLLLLLQLQLQVDIPHSASRQTLYVPREQLPAGRGETLGKRSSASVIRGWGGSGSCVGKVVSKLANN